MRLLTLEEQGEWQFINNCTDDAIDEGGWIWIVQRFVPAESNYNDYSFDVYECKSIATGAIMQLFPKEITTRPMKENTNDVTETDK